jgi:hypothetical protein
MRHRFDIIDGRCVIPHGVKDVIHKEFAGALDLREVVIPATVINICSYTFSNCRSLGEVTLPYSVTGIGQGAFSDCPLKSIKFPERLLHIGSGAFAGCKLVSVAIPKNVMFIAEGAFSGCIWLEGISVDEKNTEFRSVSNTCLTKDGKTVVFGCKNSFIPSGVRHIGTQAFEDCWDLEAIAIPEGVISIGDFAFSGCCNLKRVKLPRTLKSIGREAFSYCEKLIRPEIPAGVEIGEDAFFLPKDWESSNTLQIKNSPINVSHYGCEY